MRIFNNNHFFFFCFFFFSFFALSLFLLCRASFSHRCCCPHPSRCERMRVSLRRPGPHASGNTCRDRAGRLERDTGDARSSLHLQSTSGSIERSRSSPPASNVTSTVVFPEFSFPNSFLKLGISSFTMRIFLIENKCILNYVFELIGNSTSLILIFFLSDS